MSGLYSLTISNNFVVMSKEKHAQFPADSQKYANSFVFTLVLVVLMDQNEGARAAR